MKIFLLLTSFFLIPSFSSLSAVPIDLTEQDMFVRRGFKLEWVRAVPEKSDGVWQKFPANKGNRPVRVRQLTFEGLPQFRHFSLERHPPQTFTYVTHFDLTKDMLNSGPLGFLLGQIGLNWEIYINGYVLKREMHITEDGVIQLERAVRNELVAFNHKNLRPGRNILAFRIVGNPVDDRTGLFMGSPYLIDKYEKLNPFNQYIASLMLIAVYAFFGFYHIFLFFLMRKERYNFFYGVFAVCSSLFLFCRTETVFLLFRDSLAIKNVELVSLSLGPAALLILIDLLIRNRTTKFTRFMTVLGITVSILLLFAWKESLLRITQFSIVLAFLYILVYNLFFPFRKDIQERISHLREKSGSKSSVRIPIAIFKSLAQSVPGNLIIGVSVGLFTAGIDILNLNNGIPSQYALYGFSFFVIGIAGILSNRFVKVYRRIEELNVTLEFRVSERTKELKNALDDLHRANSKLENISVTDQLTSLYNRRYFDEKYLDEFKRAHRKKDSLSIVLVDIDHFKRFNDTYGHLVGDQCLQQVASTLKSVARRASDTLARYGGEEFIVILPGEDSKGAFVLAERLRLAVESFDFKVEGQSVPVTISIGISSTIPDGMENFGFLFTAADSALYNAKENGRNQCCIHKDQT